VVNEHPAVFESAAVGVPDPVRDEQIKVYVVVREDHTLTDDELLAHCKTFLAPYKVPSLIEFVEDLPRTSVGKIQKHRLSTASLSTPVP
jgi:crotonobetaine/carnitine-CoA ligase